MLKILLTIALGAFLALGWAWTDFLVNKQYITEDVQLLIQVILTLILIGQQAYLAFPQPSPQSMVAARQHLIELYLRICLNEYGKLVTETLDKDKGEALPQLRVNIMLPQKHGRGFFGTTLKLCYDVCSKGESYSTADRNVTWKKGQGNCGQVWKLGKGLVYSAGADQEKLFKMTKAQRESTEEVCSVLSTPMWQNGKFVGILNLDAKVSSDVARFETDAIKEHAGAIALKLSGHLFPEGIEG